MSAFIGDPVRISPGDTVVTRIPCRRELGAHRVRQADQRELAGASTARGAAPRPGRRSSAMFTIRPKPRRRIDGHQLEHQVQRPPEMGRHRVLEVLVLHVLERPDLDHAGVVDEDVHRRPLLEDLRRPPRARRRGGGRRSGSPSPRPRPPRAARRARSSSRSSRASSTSRAPSAASWRASTRPSPREPPVITTTRPPKSIARRSRRIAGADERGRDAGGQAHHEPLITRHSKSSGHRFPRARSSAPSAPIARGCMLRANRVTRLASSGA